MKWLKNAPSKKSLPSVCESSDLKTKFLLYTKRHFMPILAYSFGLKPAGVRVLTRTVFYFIQVKTRTPEKKKPPSCEGNLKTFISKSNFNYIHAAGNRKGL
jgi:hypothetical protein